MIQVEVHWSHHFWGSYCATISTSFPSGCEHLAHAFGKKFLGDGYEVKVADDRDVVVGIFAKNGVDKEIAERLALSRVEDDKCFRCGKIHNIGDTAHSIDYASPITVELGYVDHPGQRLLFKEPNEKGK